MTDHTSRTLLVELLTEELPPKALARLSDAFAAELCTRLAARDLLDGGAAASYTAYATPRRLAVTLPGVRAVAPEKHVREKVLPVSVALDAQGQPTPPLTKKLAALGFADKRVADLERASDGKAEAFFLSYTAAGATLAEGLQAALDETVTKLPIPKVMSYQRPDGATVQFVRPAHRLIALHGGDVVPVHVLGLQAGRTTLGHRFLSNGSEIVVEHADDYARALRESGRVVASFAQRRESIERRLRELAGADEVVAPDALLDEVTALVEWPVVYECRFDDAFLAVPQECLILTMQTNQKYFALTDAHGKLRSRFLVVSNIATDTPNLIVEGNERVVRPRLADAKFFFEHDKKKTLAQRVPQLANVVYHNKLGSQLERVERVTQIAQEIASLLTPVRSPGFVADSVLVARAAHIAKADLLTDMVGEFPELQGTMGTYYARYDGESEEVARACFEHYQPRFAGDTLPSTPTGTVVALADKLETLVGIWGIGLVPTGDKDPFALRRHALGVLRIVREKRLPLNLIDLFGIAFNSFTDKFNVDPTAELHAFLLDRLRGLLRDDGYAANEIEAVLATSPALGSPADKDHLWLATLEERLKAVRAFIALSEAEALAAANKRITNILKKSPESAEIAGSGVRDDLLSPGAEKNLCIELNRVGPSVQQHAQARQFKEALFELAELRTPVDKFFDDVMVNADDPDLRRNRLALLSSLHAVMNSVADISKLAS